MFIHWGLYSVLGRHEWVMENEGIPVAEYEQLAKRFKPKPNAARDWAKLAKSRGQKYMVMTTKHHEGFCLFDSKLTDYCAPKQGPGRDLVREYVDAARAEGPARGLLLFADGLAPSRRRALRHRRGRAAALRRLHPRPDPRAADQLRQDRHPLVRRAVAARRQGLGVGEDERRWCSSCSRTSSSTTATSCRAISPRRSSASRPSKRAWESCMTMNDSWGYQKADDDWKTPKTVVRNLITVRARRRQLPAEHRPEAGRLDSGRIGADPDRGGQVDGEERPVHLRDRSAASRAVPITPVSRARATRCTCTSISGRATR